MTTLNISVAEELLAYIESRISAGDFHSVNDYLVELVRQDRDRMERTDQFLLEGLYSGEARPFSMTDIRKRAVEIHDKGLD